MFFLQFTGVPGRDKPDKALSAKVVVKPAAGKGVSVDHRNDVFH